MIDELTGWRWSFLRFFGWFYRLHHGAFWSQTCLLMRLIIFRPRSAIMLFGCCTIVLSQPIGPQGFAIAILKRTPRLSIPCLVVVSRKRIGTWKSESFRIGCSSSWSWWAVTRSSRFVSGSVELLAIVNNFLLLIKQQLIRLLLLNWLLLELRGLPPLKSLFLSLVLQIHLVEVPFAHLVRAACLAIQV